MPVFQRDLCIDQGADFSFTTDPWVANGTPVDLTGRTCRLLVYRHAYDTAPMLSLTSSPSADGDVVSNGVEGTVSGGIAKVATSALDASIGPLRYSLFVDDPQPVASVAVTAGGSGYTSAPAVVFSGGGGAGAAATATVVNGEVVTIEVDDPGYGYASAPTVALSGGGGTGATATASVSSSQSVLLQSGRVFINATIGGG